jgi:hypothetical protein
MSINMRCRALAAATAILLAGAAAAAAQAPGVGPTSGGWAIVEADGTLGPNLNAVKVIHVGNGSYRVQFNQDVSRCAATATIAAKDGDMLIPAYIIAGRHNTALSQIRVHTFQTTTLLPADFQFDLLVSC